MRSATIDPTYSKVMSVWVPEPSARKAGRPGAATVVTSGPVLPADFRITLSPRSVYTARVRSPSSVSATLVKTLFSLSVSMAFGLDFMLVPGATPKKPASGLIA